MYLLREELYMFYVLAEGDKTCNVGNSGSVTIPGQLASIIAMIYGLIKIGIPILLIIFGMLDLGKAVMSQKDDEIKKGQQTFVKRLIAAAIVFFVFTIVQLLLSIVDSEDSATILNCLKQLLGM